MVGEKGAYWRRIRVKGTPGHGSMPFRTDNALVKAAEVVRRIHDYRPQTRILDLWRGFVEGAQLPDELSRPLLDADGVVAVAEPFLPDSSLKYRAGIAQQKHVPVGVMTPTTGEAPRKG